MASTSGPEEGQMEPRAISRAELEGLWRPWHHRHCDVSYENPWDEQDKDGQRSYSLDLSIDDDDRLFVVETQLEIAPGARSRFEDQRYLLLYHGSDPAAATRVYNAREAELEAKGLRLHSQGGVAEAEQLRHSIDFQRRSRNGELPVDEMPADWQL